MRKLFLFPLFLTFSLVFSQGKSISLKKKSTAPVELSSGVTLKVGDVLQIGLGLNPDGTYRFVQLLNNFNEPVQPADSRAAMVKQPVKFFKEADGVTYAFTKFFVINIEAALKSEEVKIVKNK